MSVMILGGDDISTIKTLLVRLGAAKINHIAGRKNSDSFRELPCDTLCVIMLIDYLNHNAMKSFKKQAKSRNIPLICVKKSINSIESEYTKLLDQLRPTQNPCVTCNQNDQCKTAQELRDATIEYMI
jgi:hypothetical protein